MSFKEDCIFCKIAKKEAPASVLYENEKVIAFLDINPATKGHLLVIPKEHYENIFDIPYEIVEEVAKVVKKLSLAAKKALNADGITILQNNGSVAGQVIFHIHFHVIPRYLQDGQSFRWKHTSYKEGEKEEIAKKIVEILEKDKD